MATPKLAETPAPLTPTKRPKLDAGRLKDEAAVRRRLFVTAPPSMEKDDLRYPEAWAQIAPKVSRHDVVHVLACDESWELECRIETVRHDGCEISISKNLSRRAVQMAETQLGADHHTQWRPGDGWCVVRKGDGVVIIRGHGLEGGAIAQFHRQQPRPVA